MIAQMEALGLNPYEGLHISGNLATTKALRVQQFLLGVVALGELESDTSEPLALTVEGRFTATEGRSNNQYNQRVALSRDLVQVDLVLPSNSHDILDMDLHYSTDVEGYPNYYCDALVKAAVVKVTAPRIYKRYLPVLEIPLDKSNFSMTIDALDQEAIFYISQHADD